MKARSGRRRSAASVPAAISCASSRLDARGEFGVAEEGFGHDTHETPWQLPTPTLAVVPKLQIGRKESVAVVAAVLLLAAAFVVPHLHLGVVTPLINATPERFRDFAGTAPIFGWWKAHVGWGTGPAILIGVAAVLWGPSLAQRLPWRAVTLAAWATSCSWAFSLAMIDGWQRGFAGRLTARHEYLRQVPTITDIPAALSSFSRRILDYQPDSWITHVSGHPPGALLTFVWLDRIGLGGGAWAGLLCLLVGSSAATAIIVTVRAVADEEAARLAAPFVAVAPTADLGRRLGRRLFRGRGRVGYRPVGAGRQTEGASTAAGRRRRRSVVGLGDLPQLRPRAHRVPGVSSADHRRRLAIGTTHTRARRRDGGVRRRGVLRLRLLVVRRLPPCAGTLLAGHRPRPALPVLVVGQLRIGGVCDRARQRCRHRPGIRHRGHPQDIRACTCWFSARCWRSCAPT